MMTSIRGTTTIKSADYTTFVMADFLEDDFFMSWLKHPNSDSERNIFWCEWFDNRPDNIDEAIAAKNVWLALRQPNATYGTLDEVQNSVWNKLKAGIA